MKNYLNGTWTSLDQSMNVLNPFDGSVVDSVPVATASDVQNALTGLEQGARTMKQLAIWRRAEILIRAAEKIRDQEKRLAELITREEGKAIRESRAEVRRSATTMQLSGEQARQLTGEVVPLDATPGGEGKLGFTLRVPCGIVAAITPFNFPLNLVCHKVGPAIAGGNAILIKPASDTPLSALALVEILLDSGLPEDALACVTGSGSMLGKAICSDDRIRKISFTGSAKVGKQICQMAGIKRITMELGSNSPLIVLPDADLNQVSKVIVSNGFANAGQVCISAQRIITTKQVHDALMEHVVPMIDRIATGDPLDKNTRMGPMVREADAERVESWISEAVNHGAVIRAGGGRSSAMHQPTLVDGANSKMKIVDQELFGPAVAVIQVNQVDDAIRIANESRFGLSAGVFTQDIGAAIKFARQIESGNIHINWGPQWRADGMPYGGLKESGIGKEGPKYAIEEMTETKMVIIHGNV